MFENVNDALKAARAMVSTSEEEWAEAAVPEVNWDKKKPRETTP